MFGFGKDKMAVLYQQVVFYAFMGVIVGVLIGFGFGWLIGTVTEFFSESPQGAEGFVSVGVFLGMGSGAIIGSLFGGGVALRK